MSQNIPPPLLLKTNSHSGVRPQGIYSQAQDKAKTMQYAIRSGKPGSGGQKEKRQRCCDEENCNDPGKLEEGKEKSDIRIIKKPRLPLPPGANQGERGSYELTVATVELDAVWIPKNKKGRGRDWVKTITFRDLLQQLKKQKVKLLLDQDDESALIMQDGSDDDCNES